MLHGFNVDSESVFASQLCGVEEVVYFLAVVELLHEKRFAVDAASPHEIPVLRVRLLKSVAFKYEPH